MKELKVYFQKPLGITDSAYYKYLREFPPKGIKYPLEVDFKVLTKSKKFKRSFLIKMALKKSLRLFRLNFPNAYLSKNIENYDLIHCTHCLSKNNTPWVADFEHSSQFWFGSNSYNLGEKGKDNVRKYLTSKYCKKIMPWSEWSKKNILKHFPEIKDKVEVVYPGIPVPKTRKFKNKKGEIKILFTGRDFKIKGGEIAIRVLDKLTKKHKNVKGIFISDTPIGILNKYSKNKNIEFHKLVPQEVLFNQIYPSSDIFLYPTFSDTMGFGILEAQSYGLPVIAQRTGSTHTIKETIIEGKTGLIVENMKADGHHLTYNEEIVDKFVTMCEKLINSEKFLKKIGENARKEIENGRFSIKKRNSQLKRIYEDSINN